MRRPVMVLLSVVVLVWALAPQAQAGPAGPPGKPENVAVTLIYDAGSMYNVYWNLTWQPPANDGGSPITGYTVYVGDETTPLYILGTTTETHFGMVFPNASWDLNRNSIYVRALSDSEFGPGSHFTSTTIGKAAGAPQNVSVTAGLGSLNVSWAPAAAGDYPLAGYDVHVVAENGSYGDCTTAATSCTVTGLVNGTSYTVRVRAKDVNGILGDQAEAAGTWMVGLVPGPPTGVAATAAANKVTVTWKAPASDGGIPVTRYRVKPSTGGATCETTKLTCTLTVAFGTTYTFTVKALNAKGESPASLPSKPITVKKLQVASFNVPKRIKPAGTTVLLNSSITTNAGRRAHVSVTVRPAGTKYASITTTAQGKTTIRVRGHHLLRVTLRLRAPGTKKFEPYRYVKEWTVKG